MVSACLLCLIYSSQQLCKMTTHNLICQLKNRLREMKVHNRYVADQNWPCVQLQSPSSLFLFNTPTPIQPLPTHWLRNLSPVQAAGQLPGWGHANSPASWSCMCWSLIEGEEDQPMTQWLSSFGKCAFGLLLQPSPSEKMGPDRHTAGDVAGLQCSDWYLLRFWYWMSFF